MKISIDFDGTITRYPEFFSAMMRAMQNDGHQVGILTGHHHEQEKDDLKWLLYHDFPVPDFWIGRSPTNDPDTSDHKLTSIARHKIDLHFDDCDLGNPGAVEALCQFANVICIR